MAMLTSSAVRGFTFALSLLALSACANTQQQPKTPIADPQTIQKAVDAAHAKWKKESGGKNADYIPYLAKVPSDLFGIVVVTADGQVFTAGDVDYGFSIQSASKPFTAALVMQESGIETIREKIGVEPTGLPFNSVTAIEQLKARSVNPCVNAGAMATVSLIKAKGAEQRWQKIQDWFALFAGEPLELNKEVYESEAATNQHNQAIARLLQSYDRFYCDPPEAVDVYTKQCSLNVTARQLAMMGATLANNGVNPKTGKRVVDAAVVPHLLAVMMMCGLYDEAGAWAWMTGLPAKSGVGGGVVAVVPGRMAIVGFAPPLNEAGNSWRGTRAVQSVVQDLGLNLFGTGK
jgi:glutaminase